MALIYLSTFSQAAHAVLMECQISGVASGSLGGDTFDDTPFQMRLFGETDLLSSGPGFVAIDPLRGVTVDITGHGGVTLRYTTRFGSTPKISSYFSPALSPRRTSSISR